MRRTGTKKVLILFFSVMVHISNAQYPTPICNNPPNQNDFDALVAFYCSTDGDNWGAPHNDGWLEAINNGTNCNYCTWNGITSNSQNRVSGIKIFPIPNITMNGSIPSEVFNLTELERFEFWGSLLGWGMRRMWRICLRMSSGEFKLVKKNC